MDTYDKDKRIQELEELVKALQAQIEDLKRQLGINSQNSSMPPSSDPPSTPKKPPKKKKAKRGAQKGHEPHLKELLPKESITKQVVLNPEACPDCGGTHFEDSPEPPLRDQFLDLPPVVPDVIEYLRPVRACSGCGAHAYALLPDDAPKSTFGSGVLATIGILTGVLNTSKRKALLIMNEVFHIPMSLGGLSNCEERIAATLEAPRDEALAHIRQGHVAHADETGWSLGNRLRGWLWTICSATAAAFMVHSKRGQDAARDLLGDFGGVLVTDRWGGYNGYEGRRQVCWAHLKRDFTAISEAGGTLGKIGSQLHDLAKRILHLRKRVRDGTLRWETFQSRMPPLRTEVERLLKKGASEEGSLGGKCRRIHHCGDDLWTFVSDARVDPTNNHAERMVRPGVLWRKMSFGTQSERGARYVERVLTVCATCRLQGRNVIEYIREACRCHILKLPVPSLIT